MKLSKSELAVCGVCAGFLLFLAGWFGRGLLVAPGTYTVTAARPVTEDRAAPPAETTFFVPDTLLDLNTALLEDLEGLPGIGTVRAQAILDYREANGPFRRVEDLTLVEGIGQATLEGLLPYITVTTP